MTYRDIRQGLSLSRKTASRPPSRRTSVCRHRTFVWAGNGPTKDVNCNGIPRPGERLLRRLLRQRQRLHADQTIYAEAAL